MPSTPVALEYLNTALICCVLVVVVASLIGIYTRESASGGVAAPLGERPPTLSQRGGPSQLASTAGRTLVIPMGFYYGTYVIHCWLRTYRRPFRLRVDSGSSVMLFGDLPGCIDGASTICDVKTSAPTAADTVMFGQSEAVAVQTTEFKPGTMTLGFIDGTPRVEPQSLRVRVADNSREFTMPLGFSGGKDGLMNQLTVRRLQIWLVQETWSIRMPCQIVLSPSVPPDPARVILRAPIVPAAEFVRALGGSSAGGSAAGSINAGVVPTYVFRVKATSADVSPDLEFAIIDIGSTLSYVPTPTGTTKLSGDVKLDVVGTPNDITLSEQETLPLSHTVALNRNLGDKVAVIGNRALNHLVVDIDLDDGPTGTIRLMHPI